MNSVLYWNAILLEASRRDFTRGFPNGAQPGPIRTSRAMAIVHLAIHDALAYAAGAPNTAYLTKKRAPAPVGAPPAGASKDEIVAGAAVTALKALYWRQESFFDQALAFAPSAAFAYGAAVADALIAFRATDGWDNTIFGDQPAKPNWGQHRADPFEPSQRRLGPRWGAVNRFVAAGHQPLGDYPGRRRPDLLSDPHYRKDFEEVRDYGALSRGKRSAEQERIGVYWGYDGVNGLGVPPRLYNQIARELVGIHKTNLNQTAELFAHVNVAMADAGIDAWYHKYDQDLWRPVVGIRLERAGDGDPFWAPLGAPQTNGSGVSRSPGFPAYPSGHATFGAALFQSLRLALGTGPGPISVADVLVFDTLNGAPPPKILNETFTFVSDELDGVAMDPGGSARTRVSKTFTTFAEAIWENAVSRVYLGVHWRFDGLPQVAGQNIGGVPLGLEIGKEAYTCFGGHAHSLGKVP